MLLKERKKLDNPELLGSVGPASLSCVNCAATIFVPSSFLLIIVGVLTEHVIKSRQTSRAYEDQIIA